MEIDFTGPKNYCTGPLGVFQFKMCSNVDNKILLTHRKKRKTSVARKASLEIEIILVAL